MKTYLKVRAFNECSGKEEFAEMKISFESEWIQSREGNKMLTAAKDLKVDEKLIMKASALCAKKVYGLMADARSRQAVDAVFKYLEYSIDEQMLELKGEEAREALSEVDTATAGITAYYAAKAAFLCIYPNTSLTSAVKLSCLAAAEAASTNAYDCDAVFKSTLEAFNLAAAVICREVLSDKVFAKLKEMEANFQAE
jgi:hypothetical protein